MILLHGFMFNERPVPAFVASIFLVVTVSGCLTDIFCTGHFQKTLFAQSSSFYMEFSRFKSLDNFQKIVYSK
jgi:hypothetical protein